MKSHRGISAIIGTIFLVIVVAGALTYVSSSLETMSNFSEQLVAEESRQKNIQDEKFDLIGVDIVSDKLDATIKNTGDIPVKITALYLDEMDANDVVQKYTIDKTISPGTTFNFLDESIDVDVDPTKGYTMKFASSRGAVKTFYLNSASQEPLDIRLIALPERVPIGFATTLMMVVVNNMSNNNPLVNLTPVDPDCSGICVKLSGPTPASYDTLAPGDAAIFEWVFELDGNNDEYVTFTGQLENGYPGNTDSKTVTITPIESAEIAGLTLESLGFGHSTLLDNAFLLHVEDYGVPNPNPLPPSTIPNPIHNYELNNDATDEMGGTNLQLSDGGAGLTATGWDWVANDGATIVAGEIPELEYAIEIVFSFDDTDGWGALLEYHNFQGSFNDADPENGIYVQTKNFDFWQNYGQSANTLNDFTLTHVLIQRTASGTFEMYQDGALAFTFDDSISEEAIFRGQPGNEFLGQPAIFFKDNTTEETNGFVDCIRVFDTAMSSADAITVTTNSNTCYDFAQVGSGPFQMTPSGAESSGTVLVFNGVNDRYQFFSANATTSDIAISAGNWNASLRYNSPRLPSGMAAGASVIYDTAVDGGGHTLHFNTNPTLARKDSGQMSACTSLVDSGTLSGATWGATSGVNGSGGYYFDGDNDYITISHTSTLKSCNNPDGQLVSIAGWFKSPVTASHIAQYIFYKYDSDNTDGERGGFYVRIGDGTSANHGAVLFQMLDDNGATTRCQSDEPDGDGGNNYLDNNWHHFAAVEYAAGKCKLYIDGVQRDDVTGTATAHDHYTPSLSDVYIGVDRVIDRDFTGYIDDIMFWNNYALTASDVTALFQHSFGQNSTRLNFYLNNATGTGTTIDVLAADTNYGMPWVDQMTHTDLDDLWAGGNWTKALPAVGLKEASPFNRLNFTIGYASGAPLNLRIDDEDLDGTATTLISSYLQTPPADPELPIYRTYDNDDKVTFYTFNGGTEGVWFTYQGTRIVFNGTGGHYTGVVDSVNNGIVESELQIGSDSPFIRVNSNADVVFWHPQNIPTASQPSNPDKIIPGYYDVNVWIQGYDEDGTVFIRQIALGSVLVLD